MPTRVVLQETAPPRRHNNRATRTNPTSPSPRTPNNASSFRNSSSPKTPGYSLRKALQDKGDVTPTRTNSFTTSAEADIRSSPRITGYLYSLLCCSVMLVSIVQFFFKNNTLAVAYVNQEHYVSEYGVYRWKLYGSFGMSTAGILIYLIILLAHFDTFLLADYWSEFFQDGSIRERNLILCLILFWVGVLFMCTSTLSVGSVQANVYFTSWIGFGANIVNYNVWRTGAGLETWGEKLAGHRETTFNWTCTLFFATVASCGATDAFANQDELSLYVAGSAALYEQNRRNGLILSWTSVGISIVALLGNHFFTTSYSMTCCKCMEMTLDWCQIEFACLVFMLALYGYVLFVYTGTVGVFNSPSNTYFGIWGTFFSAIVTFGTWIKENRTFLLFRKILPPSPQGGGSQRQSARQSSS